MLLSIWGFTRIYSLLAGIFRTWVTFSVGTLYYSTLQARAFIAAVSFPEVCPRLVLFTVVLTFYNRIHSYIIFAPC